MSASISGLSNLRCNCLTDVVTPSVATRKSDPSSNLKGCPSIETEPVFPSAVKHSTVYSRPSLALNEPSYLMALRDMSQFAPKLPPPSHQTTNAYPSPHTPKLTEASSIPGTDSAPGVDSDQPTTWPPQPAGRPFPPHPKEAKQARRTNTVELAATNDFISGPNALVQWRAGQRTVRCNRLLCARLILSSRH